MLNNELLRSQLLDALNNCTLKVFTKIEDGSVEVKLANSNLQLSLSKSLLPVAKALEKEAMLTMNDCEPSIVL